MKIDQLAGLGIRKLLGLYAKAELSPVEVMQATLEHSDAVNGAINALFHVAADEALTGAKASEERWRRKSPMGRLDGVPVTVKDSVNVAGWPYLHGAKPNRDRPLATEDAPPAARLKESGAIIFAKTTMPDCGLLGAGVSSAHGITRNPWKLSANPGGSSAGAGASLAAGLGFGSVGSDIAGSVRLPASQCGLAALKPTQGLIPHLAPDIMRSAGPMGRSVGDIAAMLTVLAEPDPRDCWSLPPRAVIYEEELRREMKNLKIGLLLDMGFDPRPEPEIVNVVRQAGRVLAEAGAEVSELPPPFDRDAYKAIDQVLQIRGHAEIQAFAPERRHEVTEAVRQWCEPARHYSALDFAAMLQDIARSRASLEKSLRPYDYVLAPVLPAAGFPAEAPGLFNDVPLRHANFTALFNQTAQPASSVHQALIDGLPVGVQVIGRRFDDLGVLQVSRRLEEARGPVAWPVQPRG
jgi:amidase/aspartyl-tRNA(Asn)/glutamyl-tRNA(Gln) amidotransferase subunit A